MKKKFLFSVAILLVFLSFFSCGFTQANQLDIKSKSAILLSADTGEILYQHNADEKRPIASMVKIMTLLLCFDNIQNGKINFDDNVVISHKSSSMGGSQAFLDEGKVYKAEDLIKSIIIASANDSCVAMAEHISGSVEDFVIEMNKKAKQLEMNDTVFVNCTGLPVPGQFSTAKDVSKMFNTLIKYPQYFKYTTIWMEDFVHPDGRVTGLTNTNKLIRQYNGCDAGKTGYTSEAMHCLAATAIRNDMRLISVIVGGPDSKTRFNENKMLFDYGFANYQTKIYLKQGEIAPQQAEISSGKTKYLNAIADKKLVLFGEKGKKQGDLVIEFNKNLKAPIKQGDIIGKAMIKDGEKILAQTNLLAESDVFKSNLFDNIKQILQKW